MITFKVNFTSEGKKNMKEHVLSPKNHSEFHESAEITDPMGRSRIYEIHKSSNLRETKTPDDLMNEKCKSSVSRACLFASKYK